MEARVVSGWLLISPRVHVKVLFVYVLVSAMNIVSV